MSSPAPGSVTVIFATIERLIDGLAAMSELQGVRVDFEAAAQDDDPNEMIAFGEIQQGDQEIEVLSGGQSRVAREEHPVIVAEVRVRGTTTMRQAAKRAFELASFLEDLVSSTPKLDGDVAGLNWIVVSGVTGEATRTAKRPRYIVTVELTARARLRGA